MHICVCVYRYLHVFFDKYHLKLKNVRKSIFYKVCCQYCVAVAHSSLGRESSFVVEAIGGDFREIKI